MSKIDTYQIVTDRICKALEGGVCPWRKPWEANSTLPQNFNSKRRYNGMNLLILAMAGFGSPYWLTFNQVKKMGGNVKKGEKATPVTFWKIIESKTETDNKGKPKKIFFLKYFNVFNAEQTEGIEFPTPQNPDKIIFNPIIEAEQVVASWEDKPEIKHGSAQALYSRNEDLVRMPKPESFHSADHYYATLFHELGHSTGHQNRLNREMGKRFGDKAYAYEELVAELTSAFICAELGLDNSLEDNAAAYIKSWLEKLRNDPKMIVTASGLAQKAANMILQKAVEESQQEEAA
jgi:antirestriction protein ArdC